MKGFHMNTLNENLFFDKEKRPLEEIKLWRSKNPEKSLYIWGTGSVAAGAARELMRFCVPADGCFVNVKDYNLDSRISKLKLPIFLLDDLLKRNECFSVVVGHSHYELAYQMEELDLVEHVWFLSGAVRDDDDITADFLKENLSLFEATYHTLADSLSRKNMAAYLNAKINRDDSWIIRDFSLPSTYFSNDVIQLDPNEVYLDLGSYDGKSLGEFLRVHHGSSRVVAVEVQPHMYQKLLDKWGGRSDIQIENIGISDHEGTDNFLFDDQSTCISKNSGETVQVTTVDALTAHLEDVTTLKICIGNTILPILKGAVNTIRRHLPKMIISAGIDQRALIDYIPFIETAAGNGNYQYYLRFTNAVTECLTLYAIPGKRFL